MTLRTRLVLVVAVAVALVVASASVTVYFLVRTELRNQVDNGLVLSTTELKTFTFATVRTATPGVWVLTTTTGEGVGVTVAFRLVRSDGTQFVPYGPTAPLVTLPVTAALRAEAASGAPPSFSDTTVQGRRVRILTSPYRRGVLIQVAVDVSSVNSELSKIKLWLALVAAGGIGLASIVGFLVSRASLGPVRRLSDTAEHVRATQDLTQRIDVTGNDELSRLALTFNAMLESLDEASKRQRQLVQDASHELRTPLTSLRTNIEVLTASDSIAPEERTQLLADVVAQVSEMTALITELTELARGQPELGEMAEIRFDLIVADAIRRTERNHPALQINADLEPTPSVGMPGSLERAVGNLLDNAAKWTPAGEAIDVRLADGELTVRDHGPGIPKDDLPHIFDRFYRATSARSMAGSGLGLAIVKHVADAHGATITAEQAPGGGTIMRFKLNGAGSGETHSESPAPL